MEELNVDPDVNICDKKAEMAPESSGTSEESPSTKLSKRQMKRLTRHKKWEENKVLFRALKKEEKKKRKKEQKERSDSSFSTDSLGLSRQTLKKMRNESPSNIKVCIDMSFDHLMQEPSIRKILKQMQHSYALNRRSPSRIQFFVSSFIGQSKEIMTQTRPGYLSWDVTFKDEPYFDVFPKDKIVYLTSESPNVLEKLKEDEVYIIGGLVDHNSEKGLCYNLAVEKGIATARLPIDEHIILKSRKVLTVNHVFHILLLMAEGSTWTEALLTVIPQRKGATSKDEDS